MAVVVVRHAVALSRRGWDGPDHLRPLDDRGQRQAEALVNLLRPYAPGRILSSPSLRCTQTVAPLAQACGIDVEERDELAEGMARSAVKLGRKLCGEDAVLCTHGDVIPRLLEDLVVHDGVDLGPDPRWRKGSAWVLESGGGRFSAARYLPAPT